MYDEENDEFERPQNKAPQLPRELSEALFDYSDPTMPMIRYSAIGPERWPAAVAYGAKSGFTTWRNPRAQEVRLLFNLGPDAQLHTGFEMGLIPPAHRIPRGIASDLLKTGQALRREYNRLLIVIPSGASLAIPVAFDNAIRTVRDGIVVSGGCPWLVRMVDGQDETDPPPIHPSLLPAGVDDEPPPARGAAARRRL